MKRACLKCGRIVEEPGTVYCPGCAPTPRPRGSRGMRLRHLVLQRDEFQCVARLEDGTRCPETTNLEIDHITGLAQNGTNDPDNLRTLCRHHHRLVKEL